jgi:hypothetical protein
MLRTHIGKQLAMPTRRTLSMIWMVGSFAAAAWFWLSYSGPFRWAAEWQMDHLGQYEVKPTLVLILIVLLLPCGFLGRRSRPAGTAPVTPATDAASSARNARILVAIGAVACAICIVALALGFRRMETPLTRADLVLNTGEEAVPPVDLVSVTGIARTDMIVTFRESMGRTSPSREWKFVPLVPAGWQRNQPIRFILKTNQTAWFAPRGGIHALERNAPVFRITTEPAVLSAYELPGAVRARYERSNIPLASTVEVIEQSPEKIEEPYWITAAVSGVVYLALLPGGLIAWIRSKRSPRPDTPNKERSWVTRTSQGR